MRSAGGSGSGSIEAQQLWSWGWLRWRPVSLPAVAQGKPADQPHEVKASSTITTNAVSLDPARPARSPEGWATADGRPANQYVLR